MCFWEDDPAQLRWPMDSKDGANGVSLVQAQSTFRRVGAMSKIFRTKVRLPRDDEPLDPGWRPFDPDQHWTDSNLDGVRWPHNAEALYYWRPTYWNGDPARLPAPPQEPWGGERLVAHLLDEVPQAAPVIEALTWQFGSAVPMACCRDIATLAIDAYMSGDSETGLRIVNALDPGLDESSDLYAPNCVAIGFLENEAWHRAEMQPYIDNWPSAIQANLRTQQQHAAGVDNEVVARQAGWADLVRTARGQRVELLEDHLRQLQPPWYVEDQPQSQLTRALTARVLSDRQWLVRHPAAAVALAWRWRHVRPPLRTLLWLARPRFAG